MKQHLPFLKPIVSCEKCYHFHRGDRGEPECLINDNRVYLSNLDPDEGLGTPLVPDNPEFNGLKNWNNLGYPDAAKTCCYYLLED